MTSIIKNGVRNRTLTFNLTTGNATVRYAPSTSTNLGLASKDVASDFSGHEILAVIPIRATANSGLDRALMDVSGANVYVFGLPNKTYTCDVLVLYR